LKIRNFMYQTRSKCTLEFFSKMHWLLVIHKCFSVWVLGFGHLDQGPAESWTLDL
jgi:hypothetical protein